MTTQIFKDLLEFRNREDKSVNGVSLEFAETHPEFEKENETNKGCWNCSDCSDCYLCSLCSDCSGCYRCSDCSDCSLCSLCSDCSICYLCSLCSDCSGCYGCSGINNDILVIPKIENIHSAVLAAVSAENALEMGNWHSCDTTHCRGGWVVNLAGEKGRKLEAITSTEFAAMQIYKASSPIKVLPVRFYEDNETAMADIKRCAELETLQDGANE
jgi:hypothetical protein